ncbi:MAG: cation:proton antiporter, partial [Proteobacteria bacterium]|nr:cation:proton antiporter [Pseudomonadota bacterium]
MTAGPALGLGGPDRGKRRLGGEPVFMLAGEHRGAPRMIFSLAELVVLSLIVDWVFRKLTIPGLVGMLFLGIVFGPYALGLISRDLLAVSNDFRLIALIVILLRGGFELSKDTLNRVGGRVLLLSTIPAIVEGAAVTFLGPPLLGITYMEAAILGAILGAVSPAVVVPLMIRFMEQGKGAEKGIPTMILAAASIDDVFVIVVYSVLIGIYTGSSVNV